MENEPFNDFLCKCSSKIFLLLNVFAENNSMNKNSIASTIKIIVYVSVNEDDLYFVTYFNWRHNVMC